LNDVRVNEAVDLEKKIRAHHDKLNALEADAYQNASGTVEQEQIKLLQQRFVRL
jgi:hypothetical protein